jgi:hypothetical protein
MDKVEFHRELPSNLPTMVVAFGGWSDAGDVASPALRSPDRNCRHHLGRGTATRHGTCFPTREGARHEPHGARLLA